jgi:eukaryotic-like serine/threonine-protein kinase
MEQAEVELNPDSWAGFMTAGRWQQIERIYHDASARPAGERAPFLEQACGGDRELRVEVERMLAGDREAGSFLNTPALDVAARELAARGGAISPGSRLGPYEILSLAGAGGMGEVWKARDTRLKRLAAVKVLPAALKNDPERKRRFLREARAASALNHPNIVGIYDIGEADGVDYIAMEYVEGKPLDQVIADREFKPGEALKIAGQVADALARAHQAGIVHRDLKPANVMVTAEGRVKLLDFGLAKLSEPAIQEGATLTSTGQPTTEPGVLMGTPHYMAPEQIEGKPADHRTDMFAFGLLLFEMLAKRRAFEGDSALSVTASILKEEPRAIAGLAAPLDRLLRKCLEKDPARRWQSAADLRDELEWIGSGGAAGTPSVPPAAGSNRRRAVFVGAAFCALTALAGWIGWLWVNDTQAQPVYEFAVPPPLGEFYGEPYTLSPTGQLSPDGRMMTTFIRTPGKPGMVWLRRFESGSFTPVAGTEGAFRVAWSPDSKYLAVLVGDKLFRVPVDGAAVQPLVDEAGRLSGAWFAWGSAGYLLATDAKSGRLLLIPESGGNPRLLGELDSARGETSHGQPQFLPGGKRYLYFARSSSPEKSGIYADSIDAPPGKSTRIPVLASRSAVVLALVPSQGRLFRSRPRAYLITSRNNVLIAYRFNPDRLGIEGEPMPVTGSTYWRDNGHLVGASASNTGALALTPFMRDETEAVIFNRAGKVMDFSFPAGHYFSPAFSHDGSRIAFARSEPDSAQQDVWICDLANTSWSRFTSGSRWHGFGLWRRDDREIIYTDLPAPTDRSLYRKDVDGLRAPERIMEHGGLVSPYDWSPDGRLLIYGMSSPSGWDIWILPLEAGAKPYLFLGSQGSARFGSFSPDSRFVAFSWDVSGHDEVYVRPLNPAKSRQWRISGASGGTQPRWSKDGKQVYFVGGGEKLMSAAVKVRGEEVIADTPVPVMQLPRLPYTFTGYLYDVSPRGDRIAVIRVSTTRGTSPPIRVILNWEGLLRR